MINKWLRFNWKYGLNFYIDKDYDGEYYSINFCFIIGQFSIKIPYIVPKDIYLETRWGFNIHDAMLFLYWGKYMNGIDLPFFAYIYEDSQVLTTESKWESQIYENNPDTYTPNYNYKDNRAIEEIDFIYTLNNGQIQSRRALGFKQRRIWHRKWLPFIKEVKEFAEFEFNQEVGERELTWKGGFLNINTPLEKNESLRDCLNRLITAHKF